MTLQVGDRVHLLEITNWILGENNPAVGTEWYCEGVVTGFYNGTHGINVAWDNGYTNSYQVAHGDLELVGGEILI